VISLSFLFPALAAQATQSSTPASAPHGVTKKKKSSSSRARRQLAPEPARIKEIQQALAREGFYQGEPTGKWDESTVAAMKNFQQSKGLPATGKIEALSLQKLGLGSPVAGLAPPSPPAPAPSSSAPQTAAPQKP
jgi:peptidoglycan hydrolase-like protein with peptidoglycan-binding domain